MFEDIELQLDSHGYSCLRYINKGAFGSCYLVFSQKYNCNFVCKVVSGLCVDESFLENYQREVEALSHLNHPNIIKIYEVFSTENYLFMILEYCSGGNLLEVILTGKRVPIKTVTKYFTEISDALCYMHEQRIAHCDIKLSNILIDSFGRAKLCDFGLAQIIKNANRINSTKMRGTLSYMSPEIMAGKGYDPFKADVWSLGVTFYSLATGHLPFAGKNPESILKEIKLGYETISIVDLGFRDIITSCMTFDPNERPTMRQIKFRCIEAFRETSSLKPKSITVFFGKKNTQSVVNGRTRLNRMPSLPKL